MESKALRRFALICASDAISVSFPDSETWLPIAPTPVSAIDFELQIICDRFPGFGHFVDQEIWNCFHVTTRATTNAIKTAEFVRTARKRGKTLGAIPATRSSAQSVSHRSNGCSLAAQRRRTQGCSHQCDLQIPPGPVARKM